MTTEVQALLKARNSAFKSGDVTAFRSARANLNKAIRLAKRAHGQKIQGHFNDHRDTRKLWQRIQAVTDYRTAPQCCDDSMDFLNNLNNYFGRFEAQNTTPVRKTIPQEGDQVLRLDPADVHRVLKKIDLLA